MNLHHLGSITLHFVLESTCIPPVHPRRVQSESNLTEVIRRNRSKNKCRHVRVRCPSIPRLVRHEFLMAVMPHDRQPHVAVATTPKEVASSGFVHEKDSTNPGMAAALRTCPVTPCQVQHGDRVRAQSSMERMASGLRTTESDRVQSESAPSPAWSAGRPGLRLPSGPSPFESVRAGGRLSARQELPLPSALSPTELVDT